MVPSTEEENILGSKSWGKYHNFSFRHVQIETPMRYPSGFGVQNT